jgi:hypothetical protein
MQPVPFHTAFSTASVGSGMRLCQSTFAMMKRKCVSIAIETPGGRACSAILLKGNRCAELNGASKCALDVVEGEHNATSGLPTLSGHH